MPQNTLEIMKGIFKRINKVGFLEVLDDNGQTTFFIPAWVVAVGIFFFILLLRNRRAKQS
ncbi:MAG TPA: hypothetical protein VJ761_12310 [Ktedonobacteraceae bacterium]|nr:hypothetical protein [Ktedonobacteraceae bacterium]